MKLYGIANCDTVRKARKWLDANQIEHQFIDFRADGIEAGSVNKWLTQIDAKVLVNKRSTSWKQLSSSQREKIDTLLLQDPLSESDRSVLAKLLAANPLLIKRPVATSSSKMGASTKALSGFNAEAYKQLAQKK